MWLIVIQMPIKAGWWDASLALLNFSRSTKHCIQFSTTNAIYISGFVTANICISEAVVRSCSVKKVFLKFLQNSQVFPQAQEFPLNFATFYRAPFFTEHLQQLLLAFAPIEISYSYTVCNKSAAEVWICLVLSRVEWKTSFSHVFSSE